MQRENPYPQQQGKNDDMNALVGRSLGQFRIVERIGAGGMATVSTCCSKTGSPQYFADT